MRYVCRVAVAAGLLALCATPAPAQAPTLYVKLGPANPPPRNAVALSNNVPVMQIELTAVGGNIDVDTLDIYFSGTGAFAGVTACGLWEDVDNDGYAGSPPDVNLVGWVDPWPAATPPYWTAYGPGKFPISTILNGTTERWLVTYSLGAGVSPGQTFAATLYNLVGVRESVGTTANVVFDQAVTQLDGSPVTIASVVNAVSLFVPGAIAANPFVLFSPALIPAGTGFDQIEARFGPPGPDGAWRLFRYNAGTGRYDEYGAPGFPYANLDPRYGWWIVARRGGTLVLQGSSTQATASFTMPLATPGWYQVGNPYNAILPLSYVGVDQGAGNQPLNSPLNTMTTQAVYRFENGAYVAETGAVRPGEGYWVYAYGATQLTFNRVPNALKPDPMVFQERPLTAAEEAFSPPPPPDGFPSGDSSGSGSCFAGVAAPGWIAGAALLAGLGAAGLAALLRRRTR